MQTMTKASAGFLGGILGLLPGIGLSLLPAAFPATAQTGATVVGVLRHVSVALPDRRFSGVHTGMILPSGTTIKTGPDSAVDVDLGSVAGVVRLTQNTVLVVEKCVNLEPAAVAAMSLELRLLQGTLLGTARKVPATANFEVKVANGIVGIDHGQFRIHAEGFVVLLEGAVVVSYVAPGAAPVPFTLKAGPAVYFSPVEKSIRPAPLVLIDEIQSQFRGRLSRK